MYLFLDTETNGKPKDYKAPMADLGNWPRVIQLAYALYGDGGNEVLSGCALIKPDGWVVPKEDFWIKNGYSTEKNMAEGIPIREAIDGFVSAALSAHTMVAHNMAFDYNILGAELIRANIRINKKLNKLCTMELSENYCKLPNYPGKPGYKWPKLMELYTKLFGTGFEGAHDALADVRACARSFFKLVELGVIPAAVNV